MKIEDAIKELSAEPNYGYANPEAVRLLLAEYKISQMTLAAIGPKLLDQMREAADWQAVCSRLKSYLRNRKKPGADAMIDEILAALDADQKGEAHHD